MHRLLPFLLLACSPSPPPQPLFDPARNDDWWRGTWLIDVQRIPDIARTDGLSADAIRIVEAITREKEAEYAFEVSDNALRRKTPAGEVVVPARINVIGPDAVEIDGGEVRLRLFRVKGGPVLQDGAREIPVHKAEDPGT